MSKYIGIVFARLNPGLEIHCCSTYGYAKPNLTSLCLKISYVFMINV